MLLSQPQKERAKVETLFSCFFLQIFPRYFPFPVNVLLLSGYFFRDKYLL
ncbi:hypothetical protein PB1_08092 [Bacillus methanolicus PB1]|uniref:Uncharacterized protein n=1 Tax=Bacillus methanolicus PB1 TaxID=997296 RepID=I3E1D5_BACMT|nr:hypothetical protein PB1_08092 [Bacillus methanolicus PB1]